MCVYVCLEFAAFISRLYTKKDNIPVYFSPVFLGLNFDKKPSLPTKCTFTVIL